MLPVKFASHCQNCHQLEFDPGAPTRVVPHVAPDIVEGYLLKVYPNQVGKVREVEAKLFKNSCMTCHESEQIDQIVPQIKPASIPDRWFIRGQFSHRSHRVLECNACHTRASRSRRTNDVLIPGIQICQECHRKAEARWSSQNTAAPTACTTCHSYHERAVRPDWDGPLNIRRLNEPDTEKGAPVATQSLSFQRYLKSLREVFQFHGETP
jgi:hypothetical protein